MMSPSITYIPGSFAAQFGEDALPELLKSAGADLKWNCIPWREGAALEKIQEAGQHSRTVLMEYQARQPDTLPPIVQLRKAFGCFANLRPASYIPGIDGRFQNVDLLIVRETTEDIYAQLEHESIPHVYESLKVTTRSACERISRTAFETARKLGRKKVTIVHKANIMKKSDGLFLACARKIGEEYPDIETEDCIVDALCMKLILYPEWFDVLLCGNLFGDIVADLCAGLVGGRSNCPSVNIGPEVSVFTTGHLPDPEITLQTSLMLSCISMLNQLGQTEVSERLRTACLHTLKTAPSLTALSEALSV